MKAITTLGKWFEGHPELFAEWDSEANANISLEEIGHASRAKVWWICDKGHHYDMPVASRTLLSQGCPYCAGRRVLVGHNDLASNYPDIARQWDYEKNVDFMPEEVAQFSNRKVWWICDKGHRYDMRVGLRTRDGQGCPYCAGRRAWAGENDLVTTRPDVLWLWDFEKNTDITPEEVSENSHKKVWWKCEKGHSWQGRVQSVTSTKDGSTGCPCCSGHQFLKGATDFATLRPDLAKQWCYERNYLTPDEVKRSNNELVWWKCELGHTWRATVKSRAMSKKALCPYCTNYKVWPGFNDLATTCPEVATEWNYEKNGELKPTEISKGYREKVWWKCEKGHEWEAQVYARTKKNGSGCPVCWKTRFKK